VFCAVLLLVDGTDLLLVGYSFAQSHLFFIEQVSYYLVVLLRSPILGCSTGLLLVSCSFAQSYFRLIEQVSY
jgi:hypothetical protein